MTVALAAVALILALVVLAQSRGTAILAYAVGALALIHLLGVRL